MRETIDEVTIAKFQENEHRWEITEWRGELNEGPYTVYRDGKLWSTADSFWEAMEKVKG